MAPIPSANTVAERWASGLSNNRQKIIDGVNAVTEDPSEKAIANQAAMRQNVLDAIDSGKWARGLRRSGLQGWKAPMLASGVDRAVAGATASKDKFASRIAPVLDFERGLQTTVQAMPNVTFQDKLERMRAWATGMHGYVAPG
jgi:hypothetical protein